MNFRSCLGLISLMLFIALPILPAVADDVRPVQVLIKELPSGAFDVQWSVPKVIPAQAMPSPQLPGHCHSKGKTEFIDQPSVWVARQVYTCPNGIAGQPLGVHFPSYNIGVSTLLRLEFLSGDQHAHMLYPGENSWQVPPKDADSFQGLLREARQATVGGLEHFFRAWEHIVFLLTITLLGGLRSSFRLASSFFLAQVAVLVFSTSIGVQFESSLAEIGVLIAAAILLRERRQHAKNQIRLMSIAACAGAAHGLGVPDIISSSGLGADSNLLTCLLFVIGIDTALLTSVLIVSPIRRFGRILSAQGPAATVTLYVLAGLSFAMAFDLALSSPITEKDTERRLELPGVPNSSGQTALPASQRLTSSMPDTAIQSFLVISAFEVRHEILIRPKHLTGLLGLGSGTHIDIESQNKIKKRTSELVNKRMTLKINGREGQSVSRRVDFLSLDAKGALLRSKPVPELIEDAWIGVTDVYLTEAPADQVTIRWNRFDVVEEIPATVTDPESSQSTVLKPKEPVLKWKNELVENPIPVVREIAVEPSKLLIPLWSLVPFVCALILIFAAIRRRELLLFPAFARVLFVIAVVLGPLGNVAMTNSLSTRKEPTVIQSKRILAKILPNIYRAMEFREESVVFDRLALSVMGEQLKRVYIEHRKALVLEERGGAAVRVEVVEVVDVDAVEPADSGGFSADVVWNVGGTVTHFGHRHFRQNRYRARITVRPDQGFWKMQSIEIFEETRIACASPSLLRELPSYGLGSRSVLNEQKI